jgi:2-polyprenyl-6-methoxyphenol hydroxylase-like FAD-dependent oxidoreductase
MNPDVIVIGAGPVGLTLAVECHRHGVSFRIVDKAPDHSLHSKALAIWSGTLEHLAAAGLAEDFLKAARPVRKMVLQDMGHLIAEIPLTEGLETLYGSPVIIPQSDTEQLLLAQLQKQGVAIERNVECVDLRQDADGVTCDLRRPDGTIETITVGWVAGCDGARSIARHKLPIDFIGLTEDSGFILVDAKVQNGLTDDSILLSSGPHGPMIIFPVKPGVWRFFGLREHSEDRSEPTLAEIQRHVDEAGLPHLRLFDPEWLSYFAVNERVASRNRVGRVFLLGDASHIHSPAGGQGMNTGMQDAFNLGWKLKLLTGGQGDAEAIAESYFAERHPIAEKVVKETSRLLHFGIRSNPFVREAKKVILPILSQLEPFKKRAAFELSGLGLSYLAGPLIEMDSPALSRHHRLAPGSLARPVSLNKAGASVSLWRELLHPGHSLLLFSGPSPSERTAASISARLAELQNPLVRCFVIWYAEAAPSFWQNEPPLLDLRGEAHAQYSLREPGWYLIRPDQYIAARGLDSELSLLRNYLQKISPRELKTSVQPFKRS